MATANGKMRMNVEGDRLSTLPDDLIHKILSSFDTKDVIAMSALSTRWRYIWTSTPNLSISTQDFSTLPKFSKFVTHFLTRINKLTDVYSMKLSFRPKVSLKVSVQKMLDYAFSHNVQQLEVIFLPEKSIEFPLALFSSRSLKHLTLKTQHIYYSVMNSCMASTWELPALTTLVLHKVTLDEKEADKFFNNISKYANLKTLTLKQLHTGKLHHFSIAHSQLSNLTIEQDSYSVRNYNVVAPQLKNLTVSLSYGKLVISAPCLVSLDYKGSHFCTTDGFHSLVSIDGLSNIDSYLASDWVRPTLTTLDLYSVALDNKEAHEFFDNISKCANLKNLTLKQLHTGELHDFSIIHPQLSNLTIEQEHGSVDDVNVVAPQLKNLTFRFCYAKLVISAPGLVSLVYKGSHLRTTDGFHSLEKADICFPNPRKEKVQEFVCLLQHLHNVQFLTFNLELVELLSSSVELFIHPPSPFLNLKSLMIHPNQWSQLSYYEKVMCNELKSYFLDNSPGNTFTMALREKIKAQELMDEFRVMLNKEKDDTETSPKLNIGGDLAQIKSCLDSVSAQIEKACVFISKLQDIEDLMIKLSGSKRDKVQPCFYILCVEADIVISQIADRMKIHCDEDQSLSSVCFQMNLLEHWRRFLSNLSFPLY